MVLIDMHAGSETWHKARVYAWGLYAGYLTTFEDCQIPRLADLVRSLLILIVLIDMHVGSDTWHITRLYTRGVYAGYLTNFEDCQMSRSADLVRSLLILI